MPVTLRQWEDSLRQPALCELLPVRDYLDGCIIRTNGCFVAGYEVSGLNTFFHADETRNRTKEAAGGAGSLFAREIDADAGSI